MIYAHISGTGSFLPEKILTNHDLEKMIDTSDSWIVERTGIRQRHIVAENDTSASMATLAAKKALAMANRDANDIDLILVGTCTPDRMFPSTACLVQQQLGIEKNIPAFDLSAACAGFIYALNTANLFIQSGTAKTVLVIGSEVLSRVVDWDDRTTCVLFGDGAGAVLLEASAEPGILSTDIYAQGRYKDILYLPNDRAAPSLRQDSSFVHMLGRDVFKLAVSELGKSAEKILSESQLNVDDLDWLIPHQANLRIISSVANKLKLSMDKVVLTVDKHGNTSSASIPLALDAAIRDGRIQRGQHLLLEAIGGGMAWGSALIRF